MLAPLVHEWQTNSSCQIQWSFVVASSGNQARVARGVRVTASLGAPGRPTHHNIITTPAGARINRSTVQPLMLVECGYVRATASDGAEWTFCPSLSRIASLGKPQEIVGLYAGLHGPRAAQDACYVLACLCEQDDPTPLLGWHDGIGFQAGAMPANEQVIIARHLMQHGMMGKSRPDKGDGKYSDKFDAAEYISAARVHLGLSSADAGALSMTEYQSMMEMKFPEQNKQRDVPSREEYKAAMSAIKGRNNV